MPGQKIIRLTKKGSNPSVPDAGFRRFQPCYPFPPRLFAEWKKEGKGKVSPGPFWLRRLPFCRGNERTGLIDQRNWR